MNEFIERDIDIVTGDTQEREQAFVDGNQSREVVVVDASDDVDASINAADDGALILLDSSAGTLVPDNTITLKANQLLTGSNAPLTFVGSETGNSLTASVNDTATVIDGSASSSFVISAPVDGVTLQSFDISSLSSASGISLDSNNVTLRNIAVTGPSVTLGVFLDSFNDITNVTVDNVDVTAPTLNGLYFRAGSFTNLNVSNVDVNDITSATATAVRAQMTSFGTNSSNFNFSDMTLSHASTNAIGLRFDVSADLDQITLDNVDIENFGTSIFVSSTASIGDLTIQDSTFDTSAGTNVSFSTSGSGSITVTDTVMNASVQNINQSSISGNSDLSVSNSNLTTVTQNINLSASGANGDLSINDSVLQATSTNLAGFSNNLDLSGTGNTFTSTTPCFIFGTTTSGSISYNTSLTCP